MMRIFIIFTLSLWCYPLIAQENCAPFSESATRLFYIQRTGNSDTIVYDANTANNGQFQKNNPVIIYWKRSDKNGHLAVLLTLAGKEAYVKRIFIALEPTRFGLIPTIHYIEIFGVDVQTGEAVYEKLKP